MDRRPIKAKNEEARTKLNKSRARLRPDRKNTDRTGLTEVDRINFQARLEQSLLDSINFGQIMLLLILLANYKEQALALSNCL